MLEEELNKNNIKDIDDVREQYEKTNTAMTNIETTIANLNSIFNTPMKFINENEPSPSILKAGMVWFKQS